MKRNSPFTGEIINNLPPGASNSFDLTITKKGNPTPLSNPFREYLDISLLEYPGTNEIIAVFTYDQRAEPQLSGEQFFAEVISGSPSPNNWTLSAPHLLVEGTEPMQNATTVNVLLNSAKLNGNALNFNMKSSAKPDAFGFKFNRKKIKDQ